MRILYVLGDVPAAGSGGHTRMLSTVRALARSNEIELMYPDRPGRRPDERLGALSGVRVSVVEGRGVAGRVLSGARLAAAGRPVAIARAVKPSLAAAVRERVDAGWPDALVAGELPAALTCMRAGATRAVRAIYNAANLEWPLRRQVGLGERLSWAGARRLERDVLREFDETWMVTDRDRTAALELAPGANVVVVPNAIDLASIRPVSPASEPVVLFVGSFGYPPNRLGLEWLAERVMPLVWRSAADARLHVAGPGTSAWRPPDERVELLGFVPELADAYAGARCSAAPLLAGSGTPLKVIEGLAYGLPVVATSVAMQGLPDLREHVSLADTEDAFAGALRELLDPGYDDGGRAAAARAGVERRYSLDAVADAVAGRLAA